MKFSTTDRNYLNYQYNAAEKLQIRYQTHALYSENKQEFQAWVISHLELKPGIWLLDVGCGPGKYHLALKDSGVKIVAFDYSAGMAADAAQQAAQQTLPVLVARADAQKLPVANELFDRVMANHMLYHVPDKLAALREMRRVLKPGGRVLLSTNAADSMQLLRDIFCEAATAHGYTPALINESNEFGLHHLELVRQVFPNATLAIYEDAFLFPNADAPIRYWASGLVDAIENPPPDNAHREVILAAMHQKISQLIQEQGILRVPKRAGAYLATI